MELFSSAGRWARLATGGFALLLLAISTGCSSSRGGTLTLVSTEKKQTLSQSFSQAYITGGNAGEYDVVVVDNTTQWDYKPQTKKKKPIEPTPLAPIRQVLHIHMYWRPLSGTTRNPVAINASLTWYVLGPDGADDLLTYEGAGYVSLRGSPGKRTIILRDGKLQPKNDRGDLRDPVGPASISGQFVAKTNDTRVRETLADMEKLAK